MINFASTNQELKILFVVVQGNDVVCKVPPDQTKFINTLRNIINRQRQMQQQQQQQAQQQQQQQHMQQQTQLQQQQLQQRVIF